MCIYISTLCIAHVYMYICTRYTCTCLKTCIYVQDIHVHTVCTRYTCTCTCMYIKTELAKCTTCTCTGESGVHVHVCTCVCGGLQTANFGCKTRHYFQGQAQVRMKCLHVPHYMCTHVHVPHYMFTHVHVPHYMFTHVHVPHYMFTHVHVPH